MKTIITNEVKLRIPAGNATPGSIGAALSPLGINIAQFAKDFNSQTVSIKKDVLLPVVVRIDSSRNYTFYIKYPSTTYFLKKILALSKCSSLPGIEPSGYISLKAIYELAVIRNKGSRLSLQSRCKNMIHTAKSMGIYITKN